MPARIAPSTTARPVVHVAPMRIEIIGDDESSHAQARAYAEYRRVRGAGPTQLSVSAAPESCCDG